MFLPWSMLVTSFSTTTTNIMKVNMTKSRMLYNSESNGGPFSKVVFKS